MYIRHADKHARAIHNYYPNHIESVLQQIRRKRAAALLSPIGPAAESAENGPMWHPVGTSDVRSDVGQSPERTAGAAQTRGTPDSPPPAAPRTTCESLRPASEYSLRRAPIGWRGGIL
eukprot:502737-Prorocentrum_minimum.AAC.1